MKRKIFPLNALRSFEAAARLGRQTAAAEELGVTHGAISRQVRQLEDYLGIPLFQGSRNNPVLTSAGKALVPTLTHAFNEIDASLRAISGVESGVLDVGCLSTFAMRWLIPRLHRFYEANPAIDVRLSTKARNRDTLGALPDLTILVVDSETKSNAEDVVLFAEHLGIVLSPKLIREKNINKPTDIERVSLLTTKTRPNAWPHWLEAVGLPFNAAITQASSEYDHYYFAIEAAAADLGACAVPHHLVSNDLATGRLMAPFGFAKSGYRYIARRHRADNKLVTQFCAWLKKEALDYGHDGKAK